MPTQYWLMKSEPDVFSIEDLERLTTAHWDGIRNYQVRNMLRDHFQPNDHALFYHSSCAEPAIVGSMRIASNAFPDYTALDATSAYFDPKCTAEKLPWLSIAVEFVQHFTQPITLKTLRQHTEQLGDFKLLQKGNRLSIVPMTLEQWQFIHTLPH